MGGSRDCAEQEGVSLAAAFQTPQEQAWERE